MLPFLIEVSNRQSLHKRFNKALQTGTAFTPLILSEHEELKPKMHNLPHSNTINSMISRIQGAIFFETKVRIIADHSSTAHSVYTNFFFVCAVGQME